MAVKFKIIICAVVIFHFDFSDKPVVLIKNSVLMKSVFSLFSVQCSVDVASVAPLNSRVA